MDIKDYVLELARGAREASRGLAALSTEEKNTGLEAMARALEEKIADIRSANEQDVEKGKKAGLSSALVDRLTLTEARFEKMVDGVRAIIELPDPVGEVMREWKRPNGLVISKVRVPLGVICMIYESRPNVTVDASSLCLKSGNAAILRGGKEALATNRALASVMSGALEESDVPGSAVCMIETPDRSAVDELLKLDEYIDVVIPRGGEGLIRAVVDKSRIPVIKHYRGNCHVYIDGAADLDMAKEIIVNAKCQRPGVCNAMETLLVHRGIAEKLLPDVARLLLERNVELRGCPATLKIVGEAGPARESDWREEYLDLILAVRVVEGLDEAIEHIEEYGSRHSDAIVTEDEAAAQAFLKRVDSATVFWNCSTRFSDGGEFGFGAEIGISTDKIHARGPMALEELTTYKYIVRGSGQVRS
ncbi:MAG: glutamate-5-semialdehyde dehydrogenase [Candidatus Tritonobacter lacicola]|nr:glutamate-5-semialdehyde dehydrogenase [Candidatus Tritonobacter lacicola]